MRINFNTKHFILLVFISSFMGCTGTIFLSQEEPYSEMIGQCFVLQQDMKINENGCWSLGELILSPDESYCFEQSIGTIGKGSEIKLREIRQRRWGSAGYCPQIIVETDVIDLADKKIFIPLCFSNDQISWLDDPLWRRGNEIHLKSEYVVPCP